MPDVRLYCLSLADLPLGRISKYRLSANKRTRTGQICACPCNRMRISVKISYYESKVKWHALLGSRGRLGFGLNWLGSRLRRWWLRRRGCFACRTALQLGIVSAPWCRSQTFGRIHLWFLDPSRLKMKMRGSVSLLDQSTCMRPEEWRETSIPFFFPGLGVREGGGLQR